LLAVCDFFGSPTTRDFLVFLANGSQQELSFVTSSVKVPYDGVRYIHAP
jgi:hypothetical protein